jgi:hypothetical protein
MAFAAPGQNAWAAADGGVGRRREAQIRRRLGPQGAPAWGAAGSVGGAISG